jgi:aminoglycoside phosphotransferase (APT) family kinase protein
MGWKMIITTNGFHYHYSWFSAIHTLAKLHKVDYVSVGLKDYGRNGGFYSRQIKSLKKVSDAQAAVVDAETGQKVGEIPRLPEMLAWFDRNQVLDKSSIVHGDYKVSMVHNLLY